MKQPYIRQATLEAIARRTLLQLGYSYLNAQPQAVPLEHLIEDIYKLCIEYKYLTNNGRVLGKTIFDAGLTPYYDADKHQYDLLRVERGTMLIDTTLLEPSKLGRLRFTEAHELAHWILHQEAYAGTHEPAALLSSDQDTAMEWQANALATGILMPLGQIKRCYFSLSAQHMNRMQIIDQMADVFGVSKKAMRIRLDSHGLK